MARRGAQPLAWVIILGLPFLMVTVWFLLPLDVFGPHHPALSWTVFAVLLVGVAVSLLRQIQMELIGERGHPVLVIIVVLCFSMLLFSTAYLAMAKDPNEFPGINTKVDALYFTVITMATVGYGDIVPVGQAARVVVMLQILYTLVFLTAGGAAISRRLKTTMERRADQRRHGD
ncbi:ion channel [Kitasatospora sp. NPDC048540]|uniref:potassium channel family protein n=1 Tax=unclassified Kitasatospora TaxID=2633591 RepID=UPI00068C8D34|nr:ion channel [Kitasatospora sp. MBT63]